MLIGGDSVVDGDLLGRDQERGQVVFAVVMLSVVMLLVVILLVFVLFVLHTVDYLWCVAH